MKNTAKKSIITGFIFLVTFTIFTLLVQTIDLQILPPVNRYVGFSAINSKFHSFTGVNLKLYTITDLFSIVPLAICAVEGVIGFFQLISRKNLFKVDSHILISGLYYGVIVCLFRLFEIFPVNYRPILIDGVAEVSYPSSTTLLVLTVMSAFIFKLRRKPTSRIILTCATVFTVFMAGARLFSGVHWLTDIIGGALLSAGLFYIYKGAILIYDSKQAQKGEHHGIQ